MDYYHKTVLLDETVKGICTKTGGTYVDATFGGGGHTNEILRQNPYVSMICIDQDEDAIKNFLSDKSYKTLDEKIYEYKNIKLVNDNFANINIILDDLKIDKIDAVIADLGVSSYQLDTVDRGFSYNEDAYLDMRMNKQNSLDAYTVVNSYTFEKLKYVIKEYGEENWADRIAKFIIEKRDEKPIKTTFELVDIVNRAVPKKMRDKNKHPAKRTFQAIRIEVNNELGIIEDFIYDAFKRLNIGGRIGIITFHSLEDKIVKSTFKNLSTGCTCPKEFPICVCGQKQKAKLVKGTPIKPSDKEIEENPRSRSAKLRLIEKIDEGNDED